MIDKRVMDVPAIMQVELQAILTARAHSRGGHVVRPGQRGLWLTRVCNPSFYLLKF